MYSICSVLQVKTQNTFFIKTVFLVAFYINVQTKKLRFLDTITVTKKKYKCVYCSWFDVIARVVYKQIVFYQSIIPYSG